MTDVVVPKLGLSTQTVSIVSWNKKEGDFVKKGEVLFTIETEKVTYDVPAPSDGFLKITATEPGQIVAVGEKVAVIEVTGGGATTPQPQPMEAVAPPTQTAGEPERGLRVPSSPRARRFAREKGVDISKIQGTGHNGTVTEQDILRYPVSTVGRTEVANRVPLIGVRGTIAARMTKSAQTIPQVTLHQTCNATRLVLAKNKLQEEIESFSFDAIFVKIVSDALREYPIFNSLVENNEIELMDEQNIAVAIGLETGLVAPVVKNVQSLGLDKIAAAVSELSAKAKNKELVPEDMVNGTFTISNLGMYQVDFFTPLVNPPQVAILGIGRIKKRGGEGEVYEMTLSLTFDHRAVDGHLAAQFLRRVCELTEGFS